MIVVQPFYLKHLYKIIIIFKIFLQGVLVVNYKYTFETWKVDDSFDTATRQELSSSTLSSTPQK